MMICCADIGSVARERFGWAAHTPVSPAATDGRDQTDIGEFARFVADRLDVGDKVSLGFECPLWIPIADDPFSLGRARPGEGNRPWSAAAGSASLTTGLAQVAWILARIRRPSRNTEPFLDWNSFQRSQSGLFLWEAFVTGKGKSDSGKSNSHVADAMAAVNAFRCAMDDAEPESSVEQRSKSRPRSLIGAALLWAGWSTDIQLLHEPCLVIKA